MAVVWTAEKVTEGLSALEDCLPALREWLRETLNEYHRVHRSANYYDLIAGDWLEQFAHVVYAAWQDCLSGDVPADEYAIAVAAHSQEYAWLVADNDEFHRHLRFAVASLLAGNSPESWRFAKEDTKASTGLRARWRKRLVGSFASNDAKLLICQPYFKCSKTDWLASMWRWRRWARWDDLQYPVNVECKLDVNWRKARALSAFPAADLEGLLRVLLPLHIPAVFLESYAGFRRVVFQLPVRRPKAVYTANALHQHLVFKCLAAEWKEEGTLLLNHQHGGGYGLDKQNVPETYECRVSDKFYSWGWSSPDGRVRPLSPPALPTPQGLKRWDVLLNCGDFPPRVYRLQYHPMPGLIETMVHETLVFVGGLAGRRALLVRPYPNDCGWGMIKDIRIVAPQAAIDDVRAKPFRRYAESRVVVHGYLGTSLLETLAMNIPTLCFFVPQSHAFRAAAQPYVDALERVGVLHRSGREAASFVRALGPNATDWWCRDEVQTARLDFIERYANFSRDWPQRWEQEFGNLFLE